MSDIAFANPEYFFLLLCSDDGVLVLEKAPAAIRELQVPTVQVFHRVPKTWKHRLRHLQFVFRVLALVFLTVALAPLFNFQGGTGLD